MTDSTGSWKLITYLKGRATGDRAPFAEHWRDVHAPLMREQPDFWRHVRRYVQNYAVDESDSPIHSPDRPDGVSELWFDSLEDLGRALAAPGYRNVIEPDLAGFVDLGASGSLVAEHAPVDDRPPTRVKLCAAGYRRDGLTREAAQSYWREEHPRVVRSVAEFWRHVRRYVQNPPRAYGGPIIGRPLDYDLALEMFFDSVADMTAAFSEPAYIEIVRADELRFADVVGGVALVTHESVLYDATA